MHRNETQKAIRALPPIDVVVIVWILRLDRDEIRFNFYSEDPCVSTDGGAQRLDRLAQCVIVVQQAGLRGSANDHERQTDERRKIFHEAPMVPFLSVFCIT